MSTQLTELGSLCLQLRSDKPPARNKAADRLEVVLTNSKNELLTLFGNRRPGDGGITWIDLFDSAVDAALKHAAKVEETTEAKSMQTMLNRCHVFRSVVNKLVEYNLESNSNLLSKRTIYDAVIVGFTTRSAVKIFGSLFLEILERGLYKSLYVRELKANEFNTILCNLFEMNIANNDILRFEVLHCIINTIEIAVRQVQINAELVNYLPEVAVFARKARNDRSKADTIRLYYLFVSQLAADFHHAICDMAQDILPLLCNIYQFYMRPDVKQTLFHSIYLSLHAIYPYLNVGNFSTINFTLNEHWPMTLKKLKVMMDVEIKERKLSLQRPGQNVNEKHVDNFIKMASVIVYLIYWNIEAESRAVDSMEEPHQKMAKPLDTFEIILGFVQSDESKDNNIWLSILSELICNFDSVINFNNYAQALQAAVGYLNVHTDASNLRQVRLIFSAILRKEKWLIVDKCIPIDCCIESWRKVVTFLISESSASNEIIIEKQLLLQQLIAYGKLTAENCNTLLQSFVSNTMLRRAECFMTVQCMLRHAEQCGLDKTSETVERFLTWACESTNTIDVKSALLNIAPIDATLIADTCAMAVINFLNEKENSSVADDNKRTETAGEYQQMLQFKYNKKFVCLELHGRELQVAKAAALAANDNNNEDVRKNCFFQCSYELLMRAMNVGISKEYSCSSILKDLPALNKLTAFMKTFLQYEVFNEENFQKCPLIKRIGSFLSHMEFQLKNNNPSHIERTELLEILQHLEAIFSIFMSNMILLHYLEAQPLEELINFLGHSLKHSVSEQCAEFEDWNSITFACLRTLAELCASSNYQKDSLTHITQHRFNLKTDLDVFLQLIKIFCAHKAIHGEANETIARWFMDKLKLIFKLYYTDVDLVVKIVEMLPEIFDYVQHYENLLNEMFVAITSLLKIAYKKSYSLSMTSKLINSVRLIARQCEGICGNENFINICVSVTKFLQFPALEIQFAVINTVTALMDANWLNRNTVSNDMHYTFCKQLFELLDYKSTLSDSTADFEQNRNSITMQVLCSLIAFSAYYQQSALQELAVFCAVRKYSAADLCAFEQIAIYHKCTISEFTKPYLYDLVHFWIAKKYPISKFPYFICCKSKDAFLKENLPTIVTCLLLYTSDNFKTLNKYGTESELVKLALPAVHAFLLPQNAKCSKTQTSEYQYYTNILKNNLEKLGTDFLYSNALHWETTYYIITCLRDNQAAQEVLGFPIFHEKPKWFHITHEELQRCLHYYLKSNDEKQPFAVVIYKNPMSLVNTINALKRNIYSCIFPNDNVQHLFQYCITAMLIIDSLSAAETKHCNIAQFFVRDTILFTLQYLQNVDHNELRKAAITFLHHILNKPIIMSDWCSVIIKRHLNDIAKCLIAVAEKTDAPENSQLPLSLLYDLLSQNQAQLSEAIALLDEFPTTEKFSELREIQCSLQISLNESRALPCLVSEFLNMKNRGVKGLNAIQQHISANKSEVQLEGKLFHDLIQRLLETVRNADNVNISLEAAKCLGEIGSLRIEGISYYFETNVAFYDNESNAMQPEVYFLHCMLAVLDKLLLVFDIHTYQTVCDIACLLIKTKYGSSLLAAFPYFTIFHINGTKTSNWAPQIHADAINWLSILKTSINSACNTWICTFVAKVFESFGWHSFQQLAQQEVAFAAATLQPLIKLMMANKEEHLDKLVEMLEYFFAEVSKSINATTSNADGREIFKNKNIIRIFLDICECIRIHNEWNVPLNLLNIAKASNYCQAYFLSVMYLELWAKTEQTKPGAQSKGAIISNETFQEIAIKAYQSIGCCDAIAGILNPLQSRVNFLNLNNDWPDILLESPNAAWDAVCTSVLKRNGMLTLADLNNKRTNAIDYEIRWRLGQWDTLVEGHSKVNTLNDMEHEFQKHHFNALKCLYNREEQNCLAAVGNARHCVLSILKEISVECLQNVYKYLTWLQLLRQAEDFCKVQFISNTSVDVILNKWQAELGLQYGNFQCKEQILAHQVTLFKTAGVRASRRINEFFKCNPVEMCLLKSIKECKAAGEINLAKRDIAALRNMDLSSNDIKLSMFLEDAEVCSRTGKLEITQAILKHVLTQRELNTCLETVRAVRLYGEYLMESQTQQFETVLEKRFKLSLQLLEKFEKRHETTPFSSGHLDFDTFESFAKVNRTNVYQIIAKYADCEYTRLNEYINSDEFQLKCRIIEQNREAAESVGKEIRDHDKKCGAIFMKKFASLDEGEVKAIEQKRTSNLCIAVENYIKYCEIDETPSSAAIYRIIALWFANKQNETLHDKIKDLIFTIPSYKFICALNQITARLNSNNEHFIGVLKELLVRCLQDHPHQTLYQLYALVFAFNDGTGERSNDRIAIAKDIILKGKNNMNLNCIKQLESMFPALIEFANFVVESKSTTILLSDKLKRLKNLNSVQCPTVDLPVAVNGVYNITSIVKWDEKVSLVGGINAPKKLLCICSDGKVRPQLLKGKDDLRQDAVMQQVFCMMNGLLRSDPKAVEHKLVIRTYKVMPLSMRSGILEWCENTIPIGIYLGCGGSKDGAHRRYRPNDLQPQKCRQLSMQHTKSRPEKRLEVFEHICANLKPVFHYFLLEKFPVPGIWFERRLAYTNSVAVTSMVGYIVGLGDRHTQNILIDEKTAEVVHIDFGIAFEQGKIMPTPETVPFRLTRDMVAPMGISETNGVFRKTCETTMGVMRKNPHIIMTILEVLLYDPLYIWKVVPVQATEAASSSVVEEQNLTARRALLCVQDKLEGKGAGIVDTYNVEVQVQRLINDAISKYNLCMLYPGWDPYM